MCPAWALQRVCGACLRCAACHAAGRLLVCAGWSWLQRAVRSCRHVSATLHCMTAALPAWHARHCSGVKDSNVAGPASWPAMPRRRPVCCQHVLFASGRSQRRTRTSRLGWPRLGRRRGLARTIQRVRHIVSYALGGHGLFVRLLGRTRTTQRVSVARGCLLFTTLCSMHRLKEDQSVGSPHPECEGRGWPAAACRQPDCVLTNPCLAVRRLTLSRRLYQQRRRWGQRGRASSA